MHHSAPPKAPPVKNSVTTRIEKYSRIPLAPQGLFPKEHSQGLRKTICYNTVRIMKRLPASDNSTSVGFAAVSILTICILSLTVFASAQGRLITFNAPGAGNGSGQGTQSSAINSAGLVVGHYLDANGAFHGFIREANGHIVTGDVVGAGTASGQGTVPTGTNSTADITGTYIDSRTIFHSFIRTSSGTVTEFDAPGAGIQPGMGTFAAAINSSRAVAGNFLDSGFV